MSVIIYGVIPLLSSVLLITSMFYGAYRIAENSGRRKKRRIHWWGIVLYVLVNVVFSTLGNTWINLFFMLLFPFVAGWSFGTARMFLIPDFILCAAVFLTDAAVVTGYQFFWMMGILYLNSQDLAYILLVIVSRVLEFMVILLVTMATGKRAGRRVTVRQVVLSIFLPGFSVFNMFCTVYMMQVYLATETVILFMINLILLVGLNVYFCVLIDIMGENRRLEMERNLYRQQALLQYQYYEREEEKYEESRKMIHDIRNHIQAMEALYLSDGAEDALRYGGNIHHMLNRFQQKYYTSEKLLNIILNDKSACMQRAGIREDIKVGELSLNFMKDTDVTALFANLLDNAVTAASESAGGFIRLRINKVRQFLSIVMENSCPKEPVKEGGRFLSRKSGHCGLGLANVQRIVEQYGGDVRFEWKEGVFITKAVLMCDMGEETGKC